jgi:RHS repeat-associated protein
VAAGSEEVLHYVRDALGSVVGLLDAGEPDATPEPVPAKLVERYDYDPYGKTYIAHWDPAAGSGSGDWVRHAPDEPSAFGNPFMWTGQRHDVAIGLYHFPFRTYSPRLGRWLQRDPLGYVDGLNMYEYVASMPVTVTDPLGWKLKIAGDKVYIKRVERIIQEVVPGASADPKTGFVSVDQSVKGGSQTAAKTVTALVDSEKEYGIRSKFPKVEPAEYDTEQRGVDILIGVTAEVTNEDGSKRKMKAWEWLMHELVHARHHDEGTLPPTPFTPEDRTKEERSTIDEVNKMRDEHNQGKPKDEQIPRRDRRDNDAKCSKW